MLATINDIRKLSISDRVDLAEAIWKSIDEEVVFSKDQQIEIDRRLDLINNKETAFFTWDETIAHIRSKE